MDLVTLSGGLGNQMFQFAFYWALKKRGKKVFLYKNKLAAKEHNGYELQTLFGVEEKCVDGLWMTRLLGCPLLGKILKHILFPHKYVSVCCIIIVYIHLFLNEMAFIG